jgi:hypothetical protein
LWSLFLQARAAPVLHARLFQANQFVNGRIHGVAVISIPVELFQRLDFEQCLLIYRHTIDRPLPHTFAGPLFYHERATAVISKSQAVRSVRAELTP